jgi:hypothetical protein
MMFQLTKLLLSQLLIKSRQMMLEFLKTTLCDEEVHSSDNGAKYMSAPKKHENYQPPMRTPENQKRKKAIKNPLYFEHNEETQFQQPYQHQG